MFLTSSRLLAVVMVVVVVVRGVVGLKLKVRTCEIIAGHVYDPQKGTFTNTIDTDETPQNAWRLIRVCAVCHDKHTFGND